MRAAVYDAFGDVEVLQVREVDDPAPGPGEVLLRVTAAAVNHLDILQRRGPALLPGFSLPHIAGMDVAGTVLEVGAGADPALVGKRVLVNPALQCGSCVACTTGRDGFCHGVKVVGASAPGGYAERCVVPASHVHPVPAEIGDADAATIPTVYATAWHGLVVAGALRAGETVLMHGAGSGVTSAGVVIAKRAGARVIVTGRSDAKLAHAVALGADAVINSTTTADVAGAARIAAGGEGIDLVFDHVGPALFQASLHALRPQGRLVFCGTTTGGSATFDLTHAYHLGIRLIGSDPYHQAEFAEMLRFVWAAPLPSIIDSQVPLDDVQEAHRRAEAGAIAGKVVLVP